MTHGHIIPQPTEQAEFFITTARGFPADAVSLNGLFKYRGEALEPVRDARAAPGAFLPTCVLSYQVVLKGGACPLAVAWYNATTPPTVPPESDLHVLFANAQFVAPAGATPPGMACSDIEFCPLATHATTQAPLHTWTDQTYSIDIRLDPAYRGGPIGFAIVGSVNSACSETHYSQPELNPIVAPTAQSWTTTLIWKATRYPASYYLGFEDSRFSASDFDFNDLVLFISGLSQ